MAILYNQARFSVLAQVVTPQVQIIDMQDNKANVKVVAINVYLNPTGDMVKENKESISRVEKAIQIATMSGIPVVLGGDLNQYKDEFCALCRGYNITVSKVGPTRVNGSKEIDLIGSSFSDHASSLENNPDFMSDHKCVISDIQFSACPSIKKVKKFTKSEITKANKKYLSDALSTSSDIQEVRYKLSKQIKEDHVSYRINRRYVEVCKRLLSNKIPILSTRMKIKRLISNEKDINKGFWSLAKSLTDDLKKKESLFLQGIAKGTSIIFDRQQIGNIVVKYYRTKFSE